MTRGRVRLGNRIRDSHIYSPAATTVLCFLPGLLANHEMAQRSNPGALQPRNRKKSYETALLMGKRAQRIPSWPGLSLQRRPYTFAQTNLSLSLFACDKAADHTFRFFGDPPGTTPTPRNAFRHADCRRILTVYQRARFFFVCRNRIRIEAGCGDHYVPSIKNLLTAEVPHVLFLSGAQSC
jgi:hypothetical protein